ncbi:hypothetical protein GCM10012288_12420 [Malaciobacter pacificus]|uniref:Uncharacterized protein n=1 Tax=Malaciobacter pacificus TaxID=1080223 RepID=A0A5C2H5Z1_9BACT|nr:hypothetical protein [Malaciobacter pacificus]QEP34233.1 hypothetical protein APAC_1108 [Malaciobacter pacificus]GGD39905.1 hypothetical protein GCM10012288_12420 [Malaciobacter pacificus]
MLDKIKHYYKLVKEKKIDIIAINLGILGVLVGIVFSTPIINQIFVWFILFGVCIRLYDFTEKIEHDIVPYDFNRILPPPKKDAKKFR